MPVVTTGPVKGALADDNGQFSFIVKIFNSSNKQRAVLIKGYNFEVGITPTITQVVNIDPKSETIRSYAGTTGGFQFNFQAIDFTDLKISVWLNNGTSNQELPLTPIG